MSTDICMQGSVQEYRQLFLDIRNYGATSFVILEIRRLLPSIPCTDELSLIYDAETVSFREFYHYASKFQ